MSRDLPTPEAPGTARRRLLEDMVRAATREAIEPVLVRAEAWLATYPDDTEIATHRVRLVELAKSLY
jgi:hypothetical protein